MLCTVMWFVIPRRDIDTNDARIAEMVLEKFFWKQTTYQLRHT